ncbi:hypothetical protein [Marinibactrum halimedae]|uniref:Uncharacterized protein n=1 Tax=Marinibactrum halimedae TaxID=1444977 RepID=A0AA37T070_9GAMM|nr:hypothetical protein [Marinibactrum halimedae]MCD9461338.1 hypothetical protein [Marinibactrum halimedae]GLS24554.1 hypothetical protein GCM10007877_02680 [Marinibactrum halimedae]
MLNKYDLIKMLLGALRGDSEHIATRELASRERNKFWLHNDWMWIKDLEVTLKHIDKFFIRNNMKISESEIISMLLENNNEKIMKEYQQELAELIVSAREAIDQLSNTE